MSLIKDKALETLEIEADAVNKLKERIIGNPRMSTTKLL